MKTYPFYYQLELTDCGPTCLRMVAKFYGKNFSSQKIREISSNNKRGTSLLDISEGAEQIGFKSLMAKISFEKIINEVQLPIIILWRQSHFVVVYGIKRSYIIVADPSSGIKRYSYKDFQEGWLSNEVQGVKVGVALLLEPTKDFYEKESTDVYGKLFILNYLKPHYRLLIQVLLGMLTGSFVQLLFPLLTQSIVDKGIGANNLGFVNLVLIAQFILLISKLLLDFIQSRIFLFIGTRIGFAILSDFIMKILKLPMSFFESRSQGDILQRMGDSGKIQSFLTGTSLGLILSLFNLLLFSYILFSYNIKLFVVYFLGSFCHAGWSFFFLKNQREINIKFFDNSSKNQSFLIQLIAGIKEIKLFNSERENRWRWENIQASSYSLTKKNLNIGQIQQTGSFFINETKNIIITYLTVTSVINGEITLGMMLSVQYIIGQLNGPVLSFVGLASNFQQVKMSIERLGEVYNQKNEDSKYEGNSVNFMNNQPIILNNVSFKYGGSSSPNVINGIDLVIPEGKVTAVVGNSGSGKSTLMNLLLRLYEPTKGEIFVGALKINLLSPSLWREKCGAVTQDGFIFSDSIAQNIVMSNEAVDFQKLDNACIVANIQEYVNTLPLRYTTKIGAEGLQLSEGQKQRLLIARAVYKNPEYLFLDESTNSLDANNERVIVDNLNQFFKNRTVVIIAHRLSTIKNADKIVVLENGKIIEEGSHDQLIGEKGAYYRLVKNQLNLSTS